MERPYRYTIICNKTGTTLEITNLLPPSHRLRTWEDTEDPNVKVEKVTRSVYEDMRYEAKLRLYNYITYTKKGLPIPRPQYKPFGDDPEIGKSKPILDF